MKFKINWLEKKNDDWTILQLVNEKGEQVKDVSVNRKTKKGDLFPDFDALAPGGEVEGELWVSGAGKNYLFPPVPEGSGSTSNKRPNMDRIVEKKAGLITEAQANKAKQIAIAQDRSAWMWAKTNASTLISGNALYREENSETLADLVHTLATKIYNQEPLEPFNS